MDRKEFLKSLATAGFAGSIVSFDKLSLLAQDGKDGAPDLVAVLGGEPVPMYTKGIAAMGGLAKYIHKGDRVVLKPNIGWDRTPEMGANTNPDLVGAIVRDCFEAGAKEVLVFDHSCDNWRKAYAASGIEKAATAAGAKMIPSDEEDYYTEIELTRAKVLKKTKIHKAILDCDVWFNIPILKAHRAIQISIAMKNLMGIIWDRQFFHRNDLPQSIADLNSFEKKPALNIVDAYRLLKTNGPRGLSESDAILSKGLFISADPVAVDTAATKFLGQVANLNVDQIEQIDRARKLGIGTDDLDSLNIERIRI